MTLFWFIAGNFTFFCPAWSSAATVLSSQRQFLQQLASLSSCTCPRTASRMETSCQKVGLCHLCQCWQGSFPWGVGSEKKNYQIYQHLTLELCPKLSWPPSPESSKLPSKLALAVQATVGCISARPGFTKYRNAKAPPRGTSTASTASAGDTGDTKPSFGASFPEQSPMPMTWLAFRLKVSSASHSFVSAWAVTKSICCKLVYPNFGRTSTALTITKARAKSTKVTSAWPSPKSNTSTGEAVGRSLPVCEPATPTEAKPTGAACPGAPGISKFPRYWTCRSPFSSGVVQTSASYRAPVFKLWIFNLATVPSPTNFTPVDKRRSSAKGATAASMFPQSPWLLSMCGSFTPHCAKLKVTDPGSLWDPTTAILLVGPVPPPKPPSCCGCPLPMSWQRMASRAGPSGGRSWSHRKRPREVPLR